jgi:hypothetical protein
LEPFLQPDVSNLPLLFGGFVKLGGGVVLEASSKNFQNLRCGFTGRTNDEDTIEAALVLPIRVRQSLLYATLGLLYIPLLLRRPFY